MDELSTIERGVMDGDVRLSDYLQMYIHDDIGALNVTVVRDAVRQLEAQASIAAEVLRRVDHGDA